MSCFWKGNSRDRNLSSMDVTSDVVAKSIESDDGYLNDIIGRGKWKYKSCVPVDFILGSYDRSLEEWYGFMNGERLNAVRYLGYAAYYDDLWNWWSKDPTTAPVTIIVQSFRPLVLDVGNRFGVPLFDGNHRFALALEHGWEFVPCFLGKPRP